MILFYRIICDVFWQYKELSILLNIFILFITWYKIETLKFNIREKSILIPMLIINVLFVYSFFLSFSETSEKIIFKLLGSSAVFIYSFYERSFNNALQRLTKLSYIVVGVNVLFSFLGIGFQYWGDVNTFSGLFYFKTDLALTISTCFVFIMIDTKVKPYIKYLFLILSFYLIYLSNARAYYVIILLIFSIYYFRSFLFKNARIFFLIILPTVTIIILVSISILTSLFAKDFLVLDIFSKEAYSEQNMQGRNVIWEILYNKFMRSDILEKIFGMGLDADTKAIIKYSNGDKDYNSHNSYIYIIISTGVVGFLTFLSIIRSFFLQFLRVSHRYFASEIESKILILFVSHFLIFLISSFSNVTLIFQQETWFLFYFSGLIFRFKTSKTDGMNISHL